MHNLSDSDSVHLKTATRRQIKDSGGQESASLISRVNQASMSNYQNPDKPEMFMPVDVAVNLMRDSGQTHLLDAMCRLLGGYFCRPAGVISTATMAERLGALGKEIGDVFAVMPRVLMPGESVVLDSSRGDLVREVDEAIAELVALRNQLSAGEKRAA